MAENLTELDRYLAISCRVGYSAHRTGWLLTPQREEDVTRIRRTTA